MKHFYVRRERDRDWRVYYGEPENHSHSESVSMHEHAGSARRVARDLNRRRDQHNGQQPTTDRQ